MADLKTYTKTQRALSDKDMALFSQTRNNSGDPDALYDLAIARANQDPDSMDLRAISDMDLNRYKGLFEEQRAMSDKDLKTYSISIRGGQQQILALTPEQVYDLMRNYGPDASITPVDSRGIGSLRPML